MRWLMGTCWRNLQWLQYWISVADCNTCLFHGSLTVELTRFVSWRLVLNKHVPLLAANFIWFNPWNYILFSRFLCFREIIEMFGRLPSGNLNCRPFSYSIQILKLHGWRIERSEPWTKVIIMIRVSFNEGSAS